MLHTCLVLLCRCICTLYVVHEYCRATAWHDSLKQGFSQRKEKKKKKKREKKRNNRERERNAWSSCQCRFVVAPLFFFLFIFILCLFGSAYCIFPYRVLSYCYSCNFVFYICMYICMVSLFYVPFTLCCSPAIIFFFYSSE